ncbi:hypothetical protein EDF81_2206 [Enterobacter sp. BIGb0383]|uniref:hypothetical protein n=1 Tax=unclassified Enterobacter TaxID=2608935 RepID=UPI000F48B6F3|nr:MULTISPECIES: hypothetical protein [unclassified Enterobacter]ROP59404.1 hypothetical protein EDF81_2206 [Enterobacter sp. BIGb0383]ROS09130.1 hypothetical protein EC848_2636 [Enterobacter sp. BIGb0359]
MNLKLVVALIASLTSISTMANEAASSKPLPLLSNSYAGVLCGSLDGEPAGEKLVSQGVQNIKIATKRYQWVYQQAEAKRVAVAYAYRDRDKGGDCLANVQDEYWAPKNQ